MDVSAVSGVSAGGASAIVAAHNNPANNVAGGVEESTEKTGDQESQEGSQVAVQAAASESGVGNTVNIQV